MKWFGVVIVDPEERVTDTPVGAACGFCEEPIEMGDRGVTIPYLGEPETTELPFHFECHIRSIVGSVAHQMGRCRCFGGTESDPPDVTRREAARAAYRLWKASQWRCDGTNN